MPTAPFYDGPSYPTGGRFVVQKRADIDAAADGLQKAFEWLGEAANSSGLGGNAWDTVNSRISSIRDAGRSHWDDAQVRDAIEQHLSSSHPIPLPGSAEYQALMKVRDGHGANVAGSALFFLLGGVGPRNPTVDTGMALTSAALIRLGIGEPFASGTRESLKRTLDSFRRHSARVEELSTHHASAIRSAFVRLRRIQTATINRYKDREQDRIDASEKSRIRSEQAVEALIETYREHLRLKAPVEYWTAKARQHRDSSLAYRNLASKTGIVVGTTLLCLLAAIAKASLNYAPLEGSGSALLVFATMGIVATTAALWTMRIIVRLFLSEHHLAIDAEERATMALTYLALTAEQEVEAEDRQLVLAALFRPTADGIVKDDAAPMLGPSGILSSVAAR